ncbi:class I SAM-dependent methyltransferase [Mycolicibacterium aichiense]|uniref:class I SAM-dependent methyltransferase n=1 Tax=Mycolicibacterium aichiense TaxID=1799 RepID=UPI003D66CEFC
MAITLSRAQFSYRQAFIQRLLGRPQRAAELCLAALKTEDYSVAHMRAHKMLSEFEFPGEGYFQVLTRIHEHLKPATYLEIGVDKGESFEVVAPTTLALGIDPDPHVKKALGPNQRVFKETSDDFFAKRDVTAELGGKPLDLAFIDGMHQMEFALRDFINVEKYCTPDSTVLIHDVYPIDATSAARERVSWFWSGDIWRLILILKKYRPDLAVNVVAARPTGLAIVQNLDPNSRVLEERQREIIDESLAQDISVLDGRKDEMLNRFPNDWPSIAKLIDSHGRS